MSRPLLTLNDSITAITNTTTLTNSWMSIKTISLRSGSTCGEKVEERSYFMTLTPPATQNNLIKDFSRTAIPNPHIIVLTYVNNTPRSMTSSFDSPLHSINTITQI